MPRPKSGQSFADALRIAVAEAHQTGGTKLRAVADSLVAEGITGNIQAIKEIADRLDGKAPQPITGEDNGPLQVVIKQFKLDGTSE